MKIEIELSDDDVERIAAAVAARVGARAAPTPAGPDVLTIAEAAERARCSPSTLRRAISRGLLKSTKLGRGGSSRVRVHSVELQRFMRGVEQ